MSQLTAALLGLEHPHALAHLRTLQQLPEVGRILVWDANADALAQVEATQPDKVAGLFTDLDALLADPALFFAIASVRNDLGPDVFMRTLPQANTSWPRSRLGAPQAMPNG